MSGASNRRRGHNAERDVVHYLRARGYVDAYTTRSRLGHDGFKAPGDVVGPVALVIEVKDVKSSAWPTWCRQAEEEADGRDWVVVRRLRGTPDVSKWPCRANDGVTAMFGAFLTWWDVDPPTDSTPVGNIRPDPNQETTP